MWPQATGPGRIGPVFCSQMKKNAYLFRLIVLLMRTKNGHFRPLPGTTEREGSRFDVNSAFE